MSIDSPRREVTEGAVWPLVEAIDRLRPPGMPEGRAAFELRFLIGAFLLASLISLPSLGLTLVQGDTAASAIIATFLGVTVAHLGAIRLGAPYTVLRWTALATLTLFLVAVTLTTRRLQPEQLPWFMLIPLAALVLSGPRADEAEASRPVRPVLAAMAVALVAASFVVGAHSAGWTLGRFDGPQRPWAYAVDFALLLLSTSGLLFLYDWSARRSQAELHRLRRLLSVCAWCRKIDDQGAWVTLEA